MKLPTSNFMAVNTTKSAMVIPYTAPDSRKVHTTVLHRVEAGKPLLLCDIRHTLQTMKQVTVAFVIKDSVKPAVSHGKATLIPPLVD
jgi:hypothetical protein